jgi:hypothetical protein
MFLYAYQLDWQRKVMYPMSLFDPYTHSRLFELRQEQLARKASHAERIGLSIAGTPAAMPSLRSWWAALRRPLRRRHAAPGQSKTGRPAFDS